jgi:spermidine synthase
MDVRFAALLGCFVLSGFAALLYQTVWTRELSFVFGTSELAVAAVLAAYMGGLAVGSAAAARFAPRMRRPVRVYGALELAIGVAALLVPAGIRLVDTAYAAVLGGASGLSETRATAGVLFQLAGAGVVLLVPTALMGATLPLLARGAVHLEREIGSRVGALYAANTAGAIAGTVCAAFWLIPELGLHRTTWVGAALNVVVFAIAAALALRAPLETDPDAPRASAAADGSAWILPAVAVSGSVSFAYEVMWTRLLGHLLGASLHAFATMLASFLLGIALGSAVAARLASTRERARAGFAVAQLGAAVLSYAVFACADRLPELASRFGVARGVPLASASLAAIALLPITLCLGAVFPFAVRILAPGPEHAARASARIYAWNTVGAIAGALGAGFWLLPALGFAGTLATGAATSLALAAAAAVASAPRRTWIGALAVALGGVLAVAPPLTPWWLLRGSPIEEGGAQGRIAFSAVGRSSTVLVTEQPLLWRMTTNGLSEAAIERAGVLPVAGSLQYWLGFLPSLVRPETRDLLIVGLGGGSGVESVPSSVERIDVIELEPEVVAANRAIAADRARDPLADPRVRIHLGDARGALRLADAQYGAVVSQPSHPWTAGASHLYTREFFELVRSRLRPDGVFVQWIALPFLDEPLLRSLAATLVDAFGHVEIYVPSGPALLFAASPEPLGGLAGAARALRAASSDYARFGVSRVEDVAGAWVLDEDGVRALAQGAPLITDDDNQLAARAASLGAHTLTLPAARRLFDSFDPVRAAGSEIDRDAVVRALALRGDEARARALADRSDGAARERQLGWLDLAKERVRGAARHFARASEIAPDDREALRGLVASRRADLRHGPVADLREADLDPAAAAVVAAWRSAEAGDWAAVAARDAVLASWQPGDALYRDAARLRAQWRLEAQDADPAAAAAIAVQLLASVWSPDDALLHARAALEAGDAASARGSLERVSVMLPGGESGRDLARRALAVADRLPAEEVADLRNRFARRVGGLPPGAGAKPITSR